MCLNSTLAPTCSSMTLYASARSPNKLPGKREENRTRRESLLHNSSGLAHQNFGLEVIIFKDDLTNKRNGRNCRHYVEQESTSTFLEAPRATTVVQDTAEFSVMCQISRKWRDYEKKFLRCRNWRIEMSRSSEM
jgi:hypothetical protein